MNDFLAALGLLLVIEGIAFAAFPNAVRRSMAQASEAPADILRYVGIGSAVAGVVIVWLVRWYLA